jgi:hypothetical protein
MTALAPLRAGTSLTTFRACATFCACSSLSAFRACATFCACSSLATFRACATFGACSSLSTFCACATIATCCADPSLPTFCACAATLGTRAALTTFTSSVQDDGDAGLVRSFSITGGQASQSNDVKVESYHWFLNLIR